MVTVQTSLPKVKESVKVIGFRPLRKSIHCMVLKRKKTGAFFLGNSPGQLALITDPVGMYANALLYSEWPAPPPSFTIY
jgi:hypothetical protein